MRKRVFSYLLFFVLLGQSFGGFAQEIDPDLREEESAEVFLEEYSDDFQENFFEALKQKGIENYDKAINLLLKCKQINPDKIVVDYELGKAYFKNKQYNLAKEYALIALESEPENRWFMNSLVQVMLKEQIPVEEIVSLVPDSNNQALENLALTFYILNQYQSALVVLSDSKKSDFTENLTTKINDVVSKTKKSKVKNSSSTVVEKSTNPLEEYKQKLEALRNADDTKNSIKVSEEAIENFPSQPYFYFANGYALNKTLEHKKAIEVLLAGLDYLINDQELANKIYQQLADAYRGINEFEKANMYLNKIKSP